MAKKCPVAIFGASKGRVAKVVSILLDDKKTARIESLDVGGTHPDKIGPTTPAVEIEYLACVATFDSYSDGDGKIVRYLAKAEYHGKDGKAAGSSLAPFFDRDDDDEDSNGDTSISAVVVGCGIESGDDVAMIETFVRSLSTRIGSGPDEFVFEVISPNEEYSSMKEENEAYKALGADEKEQATELRTIGPGKMANFAFSVAEQVVANAFPAKGVKPNQNVTLQNESLDNESRKEDIAPEPATVFIQRDQQKKQFACRHCRTVLFEEGDLEDPPHTRSKHEFSSRKHDKGRDRTSQCGSIFLGSGLDWMGDISGVEGKLHCPKCDAKVGLWKWAGTQCSCGTWVTPAIQVPLSKIDVMMPLRLSDNSFHSS